MDTVHIIGAGPTGVTIAWELAGMGHNVHIWEKNDTCGGSWWEPHGRRDIHSPRVLFKYAYVNFRTLLHEMGLEWNTYFVKTNVVEESFEIISKYLNLKDYLILFNLFIKAKADPSWASSVYMSGELSGELSDDGEKVVSMLPISIDGVTWDRMTVWEFVDSIDTTLFSTPYTQSSTGRLMGTHMEDALRTRGVTFHFKEELEDIEYSQDSFTALFKSGETLSEGTLVLAVDPGSAKNFIKDNWDPGNLDKLTYASVNVLMWYKNIPDIQTGIESLVNTDGKLLIHWVDDTILSCAIYDDTCVVEPERISNWICNLTGLPPPDDHKIAWGSEWTGAEWKHTQTSGVYTDRPVEMWGKCSKVAMVGMMSRREITFASIESAVEVGKTFVMKSYNGSPPLYSISATSAVNLSIIAILLVIIYKMIS